MPVPDPIPSSNTAIEANGDVQHFQHFNNAQVNQDYTPTSLSGSLIASKLTSHPLPLQPFDLSIDEKPPISNGGLLPSLKAIPLASFYKLHRVPSFSTMTDSDAGSENAPDLKLPRRESTVEPPEPAPAPTNGVHNKILEQVIRTPGRQPSPQPTHLSVPGSSGQPRVLQEEGSGYVAPKFEGKELQMDQGKRELSITVNYELMD